MLPKMIEVNPKKEDLAATAQYLRRLQNMSLDYVAGRTFIGERAIQRREFEGLGLQKLIDIQEHFAVLGYDLTLILTRRNHEDALTHSN